MDDKRILTKARISSVDDGFLSDETVYVQMNSGLSIGLTCIHPRSDNKIRKIGEALRYGCGNSSESTGLQLKNCTYFQKASQESLLSKCLHLICYQETPFALLIKMRKFMLSAIFSEF